MKKVTNLHRKMYFLKVIIMLTNLCLKKLELEQTGSEIRNKINEYILCRGLVCEYSEFLYK